MSGGNTSHVNPEKHGRHPAAVCADAVVQESARWIEWIRTTGIFRKIADLTRRNDMARKLDPESVTAAEMEKWVIKGRATA